MLTVSDIYLSEATGLHAVRVQPARPSRLVPAPSTRVSRG